MSCDYCGEELDTERDQHIHRLVEHEAEISQLEKRKSLNFVGEVTFSDHFKHQGLLGTLRTLPSSVKITAILGVVAILGVAVIMTLPAPEDSSGIETGPSHQIHSHASFSLVIDGEAVDFEKKSYMLQSDAVHFEGMSADKIHIHATGVSVSEFFTTLGWELTNTELTTRDGTTHSADSGTLKILVDGSEIDNPSEVNLDSVNSVKVVYSSS